VVPVSRRATDRERENESEAETDQPRKLPSRTRERPPLAVHKAIIYSTCLL